MAKIEGIPIIDGFALKGKIYLDKRQSIEKSEELIDLIDEHYPDGYIVYSRIDDRYYKFNSTNKIDAITGRWRETNIVGIKPAYVDEVTHTLYL